MFTSTTIIAVRHKGKVAMAGDGQVTLSNAIMKHTARKIRRIYDNRILAGFSGASADALALLGRFENKLEEYRGNLQRAVVELAKDWRMDKILRRLEALMIVADKERSFLISGTGDLIEPDDGILAIGSGGPYALSAAKALIKYSDLSASEIAIEAIKIASQVCIYTNDTIVLEEL